MLALAPALAPWAEAQGSAHTLPQTITEAATLLRKQLGVKAPRESAFTAEDVASHALRCLAAIASLSRAERERVLRHAQKLNRLKVRGD